MRIRPPAVGCSDEYELAIIKPPAKCLPEVNIHLQFKLHPSPRLEPGRVFAMERPRSRRNRPRLRHSGADHSYLLNIEYGL